jgi:enamine deaminase RidA (YjgF/YER057c/UK114 family)
MPRRQLMSLHSKTPPSAGSPTTAGASPPVSRFHCPGLVLSTLEHGHLAELHLTLTPLPGERWSEACRRLRTVLLEESATIAGQLVLGDATGRDGALADLTREFGKATWPVTWTEGADLAGGAWAGMEVWAVRGATVEPVEVGGHIRGCQYRDDHARRCLLGGLGPDNLAAARPAQAARTFECLEAALAQVGLDMSHVVRTWFFLDDILGWYGDFNKVRTEFFRARRVFEGLVPASTGVGARNPRGAAVATAALALEAATAEPVVTSVASPAQCPATRYGSSFSRAVEIRSGPCRQVIVSGTASIDPSGASARPNDLRGQIELTFDVIGAILKSRGLSYADTTRAIAYFKHDAGTGDLAAWLSRRGLAHLPIIATRAAVCREELLFELEVDAAGAV